VYVSGPMTGLPNLNFHAFHAAAKTLREAGSIVMNPADIGEDPGKTWEDYMRTDIKMLCDCDTIYLLPGWEKSKGAHLELHIAHRIGLQVVFA
jgi:Domain of unknown function (DUF4406)